MKEEPLVIIDRRSSSRTDEDREREEQEQEREKAKAWGEKMAEKRKSEAQAREAARSASQSGPQPVTAINGKVTPMWQEVAYTVAFFNLNGSQVAGGRCIGQRSDGKIFIADYVFTPFYDEGFDWTKEAKRRLDTYLLCACSDLGACALHQGDPWMAEGWARLTADTTRPMPKVIELYFRAEKARAPRILAPR